MLCYCFTRFCLIPTNFARSIVISTFCVGFSVPSTDHHENDVMIPKLTVADCKRTVNSYFYTAVFFDTCILRASPTADGRLPRAGALTATENILNEFQRSSKQPNSAPRESDGHPAARCFATDPVHSLTFKAARVRPVKWTAIHAPFAGPIQFSPLTKRDRPRLLRIRLNLKRRKLKDERLPRDVVGMDHATARA